MAKIFIIGGTGFIGSYCCRELLDAGDEIVVFDSFVNYMNPLNYDYEKQLALRFNDLKDKVKIIRGDIRYKLEVLEALKATQPEIVIHLAAIPDARKANEFPEATIDINLNGTINVLDSIRRVNSVKRFVIASSSFVYGDFLHHPADESHPTNPIDVYGGTKLSCEILTKAYGARFGLEWTIIRPSAVYGPGDSYRRVSKVFVENALAKKPLILNNGGLSKLDFTYVSDTAHGFVLAAKSEKAKNEIINITRGEGSSIKEFAEIVAKNIPGTVIKVEDKNEKIPSRGALDIKKAKRLLGFSPKVGLESGIKKYIEGLKGQKVVR